jgi:hypothetical protein
MAWDEEAFRTRIREHGERLNMSERDVMRRAGVSLDTFDKVPGAQGRTYNVIEAIAGAVGLTVSEAIGESSGVSVPLLEMAVATGVKALSDRPELLSSGIISTYLVLAARQREREPIDATVLSALEGMLRHQNRGR